MFLLWNFNVTNMRGMFKSNDVFDQDLGTWNVSSVEYMDDMFEGTALSTINYDSILISWSALDLKSYVDFDAGGSQYSPGAAAAARQHLIDTYNWDITDGGII